MYSYIKPTKPRHEKVRACLSVISRNPILSTAYDFEVLTDLCLGKVSAAPVAPIFRTQNLLGGDACHSPAAQQVGGGEVQGGSRAYPVMTDIAVPIVASCCLVHCHCPMRGGELVQGVHFRGWVFL